MLTKQEMFNRSYRGLASQGWRMSMEADGQCVYRTSDGRRCAWGWVDPEGTEGQTGNVMRLRTTILYGLARRLAGDDLEFAVRLQVRHDNSSDERLESDMRAFATERGLSIPELP